MQFFKSPCSLVAIIAAVFLYLSMLSNAATAQSVVQLPEFGVVGAGSTISVPDRGSAHLASISRANFGRTSRGVPFASGVPGLNRLFRNQGIGRSVQSGSMRVHVYIINLEEMDKEVLAEGVRRREARAAAVAKERGHKKLDPQVKKKADFINKNIGRFRSNNNQKRR